MSFHENEFTLSYTSSHAVCSEQCEAFKDSCLAKSQPSQKPLAPPSPSRSRSPSLTSRALANKRPRKKTSQPTRSRVSDDDHPPVKEDVETPSPTWQPSSSVTHQPTSQPTTRSPSCQPSSQPSISTDDGPSQPTLSPSKHLSRKPSISPHRSTHHPSHRATPHSTKNPISHAPIPTCESLHKSCLERCPVVLRYTMHESFLQFSCFEAESPSAAPSATNMITTSPTVAPTAQSLSSVEIVQVYLLNADIMPAILCAVRYLVRHHQFYHRCSPNATPDP